VNRTAEDEQASDDQVSTALWLENSHAGWTREDTIAERCDEAARLRKES
jgi:hypothetical protein